MNAQEEERIIIRLKLRAEGGDVDAAKLLFSERSKRVRPIRFQECQTLEELKTEFENYMGMSDINRAESDHAAKAFDRLFRLISARDAAHRQAAIDLVKTSGLMLVPVMDPAAWEAAAETSQHRLKSMARA